MEDTTNTAVLDRMLEASGVKTDSELSRVLGLTSQAVSKARKSNKVPASWVPKVAALFNVSTDWIFWGKSANQPQLTQIKNGVVMPHLEAIGIKEGEDLIPVPMVEARLSAGTGSLQVGGRVEKTFVFPSSFLRRKGSVVDMVVMKVEGDSMQPEILDGDSVLIDQSKTDMRPGRIFAVGFEDQIYLKRIDKLPGKILLKSVNPAYEPVVIELGEQTADSFRVIGQVLWVGREYQE